MTPGLALAIDVGGTTLKGELVDADGDVLAAGTSATPRGSAAGDAIAALGLDLLGRAAAIVREAGCAPASADLTMIADRPAIAPLREPIRRAVAETLGLSTERVSVKATRPEGLGLTGDGIGCIAIAVLTT